jgi:hypothetical protein
LEKNEKEISWKMLAGPRQLFQSNRWNSQKRRKIAVARQNAGRRGFESDGFSKGKSCERSGGVVKLLGSGGQTLFAQFAQRALWLALPELVRKKKKKLDFKCFRLKLTSVQSILPAF